jgi:hypothetical protein
MRLEGSKEVFYTQEDATQFRGTSYQAANWTYLGETRGRGRMDHHHEARGRSLKRIYIYPLCRNAQHRLAQNSAPRWFPRGEA